MSPSFKYGIPALLVSCILAGVGARGSGAVASAASAPAADWVKLFNGTDLTGWDSYIGPKLDANGDKIPGSATGLNSDPQHVFSVAQVDGGPVIRVSGEIGGGLSTVKEYENYHLRLQMKWGQDHPWNRARPDSGLLYHAGGPHGVDNDYWMRSFEYQVMPESYGRLITIAGCVADVPTVTGPDGNGFFYAPNGQRRTFSRVAAVTDNGGGVDRLASFEDPATDWITLELYTVGQTAVHVVAGKVVLVVYNSRLYENGQTRPLTSGKIQLQSEGAEAFYRNIELEPISELPAGLVN